MMENKILIQLVTIDLLKQLILKQSHEQFTKKDNDMIRILLKELNNQLYKNEVMIPKMIGDVIKRHTGINLYQKTRKRKIVDIRQIAHYFAKEMTNGHYSLREIGEAIGGVDHATVLHSIKTVNDLIDSKDKIFLVTFNDIKQLLSSYN